MPSEISLIGLGGMGVVLAVAFVNKGYKTTVWNRSPAKAESLQEKGARLASTPAECIHASQLTIICLLDNEAVHETLPKDPSTFTSRTIVNLTNGTTEDARKTSEVVTALGAKYIHGGIMAVPAIIGLPSAITLYSGDKDAFESTKNDFAVLGTSKFVGTDPGSASLLDLALLGGMYGLFSGVLHAVALARWGTADTEKITAKEFVPDFFTPFISGIVAYLGNSAEQIDARNYVSQGSNLVMQMVAVENIVKASEAQGVSTEMIKPIQALMQQKISSGGGGDDISSLIEQMGAGKRKGQ